MDLSVGVQGKTRLKPRNFGDFQRYPQSAYSSTLSSICSGKIRLRRRNTIIYYSINKSEVQCIY